MIAGTDQSRTSSSPRIPPLAAPTGIPPTLEETCPLLRLLSTILIESAYATEEVDPSKDSATIEI